MTPIRHVVTTLVVGAFLAGCGAAERSPEYATATQAYQQAAASEARELAPERLHVAKQWLSLAERSHPGSAEEQHYAYISQRKSKEAVAAASMKGAEETISRAREEKEDILRRHAREQQRVREQEMREEQAREEQAREEEPPPEREREEELAEELERAEKEREEFKDRYEKAMEDLREIATLREEGRGLVIQISGNVLFKTDSAELLPTARQHLNRLADALKLSPEGASVLIEGHTDARGPESYNEELSEKRAKSVREYLVSRGVEPEKLRAVGRGESEPIAPNTDPEGRAQNRRVEVVISERRAAVD